MILRTHYAQTASEIEKTGGITTSFATTDHRFWKRRSGTTTGLRTYDTQYTHDELPMTNLDAKRGRVQNELSDDDLGSLSGDVRVFGRAKA